MIISLLFVESFLYCSRCCLLHLLYLLRTCHWVYKRSSWCCIDRRHRFHIDLCALPSGLLWLLIRICRRSRYYRLLCLLATSASDGFDDFIAKEHRRGRSCKVVIMLFRTRGGLWSLNIIIRRKPRDVIAISHNRHKVLIC